MPKCSLVNRHCRAQRRNARSPSDCVRSGRAGKMVKAHFRPKEVCRRQSAARTIASSLRKRSAARRSPARRAPSPSEAQRTIARAVRRHNDRMRHNSAMDAMAPFASAARDAVRRLVGDDDGVRRCVAYVDTGPIGFGSVCISTSKGYVCTPERLEEYEESRSFLLEYGQPFVCVRTSKGWQVMADTRRGSARQPSVRTIRTVDYAQRVVIAVSQPDETALNFYLSTGTSNPGHDFPNTFFRNGTNQLSDRHVSKCHPIGTWLDDLLRLCCVGETLVLQRFDDGTQVTVATEIRDLHYKNNMGRPELVVDAAHVATEVLQTYNLGYINNGTLYIPFLRLFASGAYRLAACKNMDLLLVPVLAKFCNWRDVQLSACLGGMWDVHGDYVAPTHHYRDDDAFHEATLIDFGAVQRLKYVLQHYDYDQIARAFVPRGAPLVDLTKDEKTRLRERR